MKLNKKTIGAIILGILVLFFFFSKTIYTFNMPEVTGTRPKRGSLSKLEISSGIASWAETESVYAVSGGTAGRVYVREGDYVEKGQLLFEMDFDIVAANRRLTESDNNISKNEADIRGIYSRLANLREALEAEYSGTETILGGQAGLIAIELLRSRQSFESALISFELGTMSRNELINTENNYKSLLLKYEVEVEELENSLASKTIDLQNLRLSRETIAETLRDYRNNAAITAPAEGAIINLNVERGKFYPENSLLVSIGVGEEFTVECSISLDNNFVSPGDTCELSNTSHVLSGTVRRVRPSAQGKTVTITVMSGRISDGETFDITFEKTSAADFILVPSGSLNQDNDGYFIYQIKRRRGIMGDEYYLERLNVYIGDSDRSNTAVVRGITFFEPIVLVSSKALDAGITVTLKNPEEFFEN